MWPRLEHVAGGEPHRGGLVGEHVGDARVHRRAAAHERDPAGEQVVERRGLSRSPHSGKTAASTAWVASWATARSGSSTGCATSSIERPAASSSSARPSSTASANGSWKA